ncbi:MAG TPA: nucleoside transporter C-terminal domain-containing protein [Candidatus Omnitrophota bacterium]|nr:nucleoside transporter C-terminal domain-containing protein [Candidatus Omnitrophota bacterium]
MNRLIGIMGIAVFVLIAALLSENRKKIPWKLAGWGIGLQIFFGLLIWKTKPGQWIFEGANLLMSKVLSFTEVGAKFVFGKLATDPSFQAEIGFKMLPVIIFTASLMALLYYLKMIPAAVRLLAALMRRTMRISGAESLSTALFVFMGIEAITALKAYLRRMTRSELFTVMTGFMATIAGSVMAIYTHFGAQAGHLLAASVMSAPAAVLLSKIMVPETHVPETSGQGNIPMGAPYSNPLEALAEGAIDGLKLAATIGAMLIAFLSVLALFNAPLQYLHTSLESLLGIIFRPIVFLMGIPLSETAPVGELMGIKTVFNEFLGYMKMNEMIRGGLLSPRSVIISTYALCGFANFGSLAILIGGIGAIAPERKKEVIELGVKSLISGTLAKFMTAGLAGIFL